MRDVIEYAIIGLLIASAVALYLGVRRTIVRLILGAAVAILGFYSWWDTEWRDDIYGAQAHALDAAHAAGLELSDGEIAYLNQRDHIFDNDGPGYSVDTLMKLAEATTEHSPDAKVADRIAADGALVGMYSTMAQESLVEVVLSFGIIGAGLGLMVLQPFREPEPRDLLRGPRRAP